MLPLSLKLFVQLNGFGASEPIRFFAVFGFKAENDLR